MLFKRRKKPAHSLTVGLRTQLCMECRGFYARVCVVEGDTALFHRWTDVLGETFAIVEYQDGSVGKVKPELVTFLDKEV